MSTCQMQDIWSEINNGGFKPTTVCLVFFAREGQHIGATQVGFLECLVMSQLSQGEKTISSCLSLLFRALVCQPIGRGSCL